MSQDILRPIMYYLHSIIFRPQRRLVFQSAPGYSAAVSMPLLLLTTSDARSHPTSCIFSYLHSYIINLHHFIITDPTQTCFFCDSIHYKTF